MDCYDFTPHHHPERLNHYLPRTKNDQFIFVCSNADISFCNTEFLKQIVAKIESKPDRTFLLQSKNPATFERVSFPQNVILGTTLESNRDEYVFSKAPVFSQRYKDFVKINHPRKMVTVEPIMDFDIEPFAAWIQEINPEMVWLGFDSGKNGLPEPSLSKFYKFYEKLQNAGFKVILKKVKE
jgi:hypothetical protein